MPALNKNRIACFISPHGYGHAARAAAVMEALHLLDPGKEFEIFTTVPEWFFHHSLSGAFTFHPLLTDIGLVQETSLKVNLAETMARLDSFLPFNEEKISELAHFVLERNCRLTLCDISPMGILVARHAGIPSVLVENFTWDWIYEEYLSEQPGLHAHLSYLRELFLMADFHIQTQPVCCPRNVRLTTSPVSRKARTAREETRRRLGIPPDAVVAMITMGGIPENFPFMDELLKFEDIVFLVPGVGREVEPHGQEPVAPAVRRNPPKLQSSFAKASEDTRIPPRPGDGGFLRRRVKNRKNLFLLPHHSEYFHPDLVTASDALIGKVGYSTLAEVYSAGIPFGYIARSDFRESPILVSYIENHMQGFAIEDREFYEGSFLSRLTELLSLQRVERHTPNGAEQAARFIRNLMKEIGA